MLGCPRWYWSDECRDNRHLSYFFIQACIFNMMPQGIFFTSFDFGHPVPRPSLFSHYTQSKTNAWISKMNSFMNRRYRLTPLSYGKSETSPARCCVRKLLCDVEKARLSVFTPQIIIPCPWTLSVKNWLLCYMVLGTHAVLKTVDK